MNALLPCQRWVLGFGSFLRVVVALVLSIVPGEPVWAEPGDLNPWFAENGTAYLAGSSSSQRAGGMFVQPDGRIILTGRTRPFGSPQSFFLVRYQPDGTVDSTITTRIQNRESFASAAATQADRRIVATGYCGTNNSSVALVRYLEDGSPDISFGPSQDGIVVWDSPVNDRASSLTILADSKILVAGGTQHFLLLRFHFHGALDTTFGGFFGIPGQSLALFGPSSFANGMVVQPDGRIVLAGYVEIAPGQRRVAVARFLSNGQLDPTFGALGIATFTGGRLNSEAYAISMVSEGRILLAGYAGTGGDQDFLLIRLTPFGTLDPTFGTAGVVTTDLGGVNGDRCTSLAVQADGKFIAAGYTISNGGYTADPDKHRALVRYTENGPLDTEFGVSGKVITVWDSASIGVSIQKDGGILVGGQNFSLAEYIGAGVPDLGVFEWGRPITNGLTTVRFGASVGGLSDETKLTLQNLGTSELRVLAISLDGPNAADFSIGELGVTNLAMAASWTLRIGFNPAASGTRTATLRITSTDPDESPFVISLTGESRPPLRLLTPPLLPCGTVGADYAYPVTASGSWPPYDWYAYGLPKGLVIDQATGWISGRPTVATNTIVNVSVAVGFFESESVDFNLRILGPTDPGAQDLAFGNQGRTITDLSAAHDRVGAMALQSDGAILVVGGALINGEYDFAVARYQADGKPDMSFGSGGKVFSRIDTAQDFARSVAVQPDGRILVAGNSHNGRNSDLAVVRYLANGTLDTSFATTGKLTSSVSETSSEVGQALAIQSDGRIVVAGHSDNGTVRTRFTVFRFNADGSSDLNFGEQGKVTTTIGTRNASGYSLAIQRDGRMIVAGSAESSSGDAEFALVRYQPDGQLDTGFGDQGLRIISFGPADDIAQSLVIQADDKLVLAGFSTEAGSRYLNVALARLLPDGTPDSTFGIGGKVITPFVRGTDVAGRSMAMQADGRIVVAGDHFNGLNYDFALARYLPNGSLDPSFGNGGKLVTPVRSSHTQDGGSIDLGRSVAIQRDGRIVVAGETHNGLNFDFAIARYLGTTEPQIAVEDCQGHLLTDGAAQVNFGQLRITMSPGCVFTVSNPSTANLRGLAASLEGPNAGDFLVGNFPTNALGPGESTTLQVILIPKAIGLRTAMLHITSSDLDENPFDVQLIGSIVGPEIKTVAALPSGMVGVPYDYHLEAGGGTPPYTWKLHSGIPSGLELSGDGMLRGTPLTAATHEIAVSATGADGARSAIEIFTLPILPAFQAGDLDPTFGNGGKVLTDFGGEDDFGYGVALQNDGRIVVAGYASVAGREQFALARFAADGSLDPTFGNAGRITTDLAPTRALARSLALQADGRILVGGEYSKAGSYKFALVRYQPNGALDPTFGSGGIMTNLVGSSSYGKSVLLQRDGRIVLAGQVYLPGVDFGAARWFPDGSLDPGFGNAGIVAADLGANPNFDYAQAAALQGDDMIVLVGYTSGISLHDFGVARLQSNGTLDPSFGNQGVVRTSFGTTSDQAHGVTIQRDGRILVVGNAGREFGLARYQADGSPDAGFGTDGKVSTAIGRFEAFARSVALQANGAIVVAGYTSNGRDTDFALARYHPDGTPDLAFDGDGQLLTNLGSGHDRARSMVVQSDGKLLVAGEAQNGTHYDFALVRYLGPLQPAIQVEQPEGIELSSGGPGVRFGAAALGSPAVVRTLTIRNTGTAGLTGIALTKDGAHAADFALEPLPMTILAPGAWVRFNIAFTPSAAGSRSAAIHIASNDPDGSPFDIELTGTGGATTPLQEWRLAHFGTSENVGDGADANDFDSDGYVNLWEYACGSDPKQPDGATIRPAATFENGKLFCTFLCDVRRTDITYTVQASTSLKPNSWIDIAHSVGGSTVQAQAGLCEVHDPGTGLRRVTVTPASTLFPETRIFLRIQISE